MCESTYRSGTATAVVPRPRWGLLYAIAMFGLAALAITDTVAPTVARSALDGGLAGAAVLAIGLWVRGNRTALDLQDWCECAKDKMTIRVIPSRRPELYTPRMPPRVLEAPAPEEEENSVIAVR